MQPSNASGRKLRFALMPLSWLVMFVVVYGVLLIAAKASSSDIRALVRDDTLWPLAMIFPALVFGKILGMMATNVLAYSIAPLRRIFESEVSATGRHGFVKAMRGLSLAAILMALLTVLGTILFLANKT